MPARIANAAPRTKDLASPQAAHPDWVVLSTAELDWDDAPLPDSKTRRPN